MSEAIVEKNEEKKEEIREKTPAEESKTETRENMIPQSRFNEVNERAKAAEAKVAEIEAAQLKATEDRLIEQGKYKELSEGQSAELAEAKVKLAQLDTANEALEGLLKLQLEAIPEKLRGLVPDSLSTQDQLTYITKNATLLSKKDPLDVGSGKRGGNNDDDVSKVVLTAEQKEAADNANVPHDEYAKYVEI